MAAPKPEAALDGLGSRIRAARREKGLSQEELAPLVGVVQSEMSAIEGGRRENVPLPTLRKLAQALDIDEAELCRLATDRASHAAA